MVPWVAWYDRYFEISEDEYNSFGSDSLDRLALELNNWNLLQVLLEQDDKLVDENRAKIAEYMREQ